MTDVRTLPSGRTIDMDALKADYRLMLESIHMLQPEIVARRWIPEAKRDDDYRTPFGVVSAWIDHGPRKLDHDFCRLVARLIHNSQVGQLFTLSDDLMSMTYADDVDKALLDEVRAFGMLIMPGSIE